MAPIPEPSPGKKPQPIGGSFITLPITIAVLCFLFIFYRRASAIKRVVSVKLKSLRRQGAVRLSEDDGPSTHEFLDDDYIYDEDVERVEDPAERMRLDASPSVVRTEGVQDVDPWNSQGAVVPEEPRSSSDQSKPI
jgi:hypothetical protein